MLHLSWSRVVLAGFLAVTVSTATACSGSGSSKTASLPASASSQANGITGANGATGAAAGAGQPNGSAARGVGTPVSPAQAQIVRTGDVHLSVGPGLLQRTFDQIAGLVTASGGFVSDSDMSTGDMPSARLVLRVASDQVTAVVNHLAGIGHITQQTLQGQDVTGQVVDLTARVTVLQSEEDAVRTLLSRASVIGDILQIQGQLFTLQTQIEQLNGQRSSLTYQTTWATISVEISEAATAGKPAPANKRHASTATRAWRLARDNTVAVVRGIALGLGWAAPALLLGLILGLPLFVWYRRHRRPARQ